MPDNPTAPGAQPPAPAPPAAAPALPPAGAPPVPPAAPGTPFATFPTAEAFNERVARAARSHLQTELGMPLDEVKAGLASLAASQKAEAERQQAELSELEKERTAREAAETAQCEAEEIRDQAVLDAHILGLCNERGVRDWQYAKYRILTKAGELPEGEDLDEAAYLDKLLTDGQARIAMGVDQVPTAPQPVAAPASTTPAPGAPPGSPGGPPPQAPPNAQPAAKTAFELTPEEWAAKRRALGVR